MVIFEFIYFHKYLLISLSGMEFKSEAVESDGLASNSSSATCSLCDHGPVDFFSQADLPPLLNGRGNCTCRRGFW